MRVRLLDYTGIGQPDPSRYAANLLLFTKSTRLAMRPELMEEIEQWTDTVVLHELSYMANTIPSSWEFINYTFLLQGVTRAFTHQLVRTRHASFAQQTMRVLDVSGFDYLTGPSILSHEERTRTYDAAMKGIDGVYRALIAQGANIEDARGILPTNILTNIVMSINMRTLVEMTRKRSSVRVQGEYREALYLMQSAAKEVHPWLHLFLSRELDQAARELEDTILELGLPPDKVMKLVKLIDQMRTA